MEREKPGEKEQPAQKRRKINAGRFKRVLPQGDNIQEKRKEEKELEKTYPIFKRRKHNVENQENEIAENGVGETEWKKKTDEELQEDWDKKLAERERRIMMEEEKLRNQIQKSEKAKKSWELSWKLLTLCREALEIDGTNWEKSKERRAEEKKKEEEKLERLRRAEIKRNTLTEKLEKRKLQTKITETLQELPQNRRILVEREKERERKLLLQEAKLELWKKWRQKKGRGKVPKITQMKEQEKESLTRELEKIEAEVEKYKEEIEEKRREVERKVSRIERKKQKERHY